MLKLLALFVLLPAIELALLIEIGSRIGTVMTLALIFSTGALGAVLARTQGLGVVQRMRTDVRDGNLPADALLDGVLILLAGAVLMTPGILTDVAGFLCLVPAFRAQLKRALRRRFDRAVREGEVRVSFHSMEVGGEDDEPGGKRTRIIDVDTDPGGSSERPGGTAP